MPLTLSSDSFGLKIKVREEIIAESQALEFLKSVQGEPSYGCLKFVRGFAILRPKLRGEVHFLKPPPYQMSSLLNLLSY